MKRLIFMVILSAVALHGQDLQGKTNEDKIAEYLKSSNSVSFEEYKKMFAPLSAQEISALVSSTQRNLVKTRIDESTVINSVKSSGSSLIYDYTLNSTPKANFKEFDQTQKSHLGSGMQTQVKNFVCNSNAFLAMLDRGVVVIYRYELESGERYFDFKITKGSCK